MFFFHGIIIFYKFHFSNFERLPCSRLFQSLLYSSSEGLYQIYIILWTFYRYNLCSHSYSINLVYVGNCAGHWDCLSEWDHGGDSGWQNMPNAYLLSSSIKSSPANHSCSTIHLLESSLALAALSYILLRSISIIFFSTLKQISSLTNMLSHLMRYFTAFMLHKAWTKLGLARLV